MLSGSHRYPTLRHAMTIARPVIRIVRGSPASVFLMACFSCVLPLVQTSLLLCAAGAAGPTPGPEERAKEAGFNYPIHKTAPFHMGC